MFTMIRKAKKRSPDKGIICAFLTKLFAPSNLFQYCDQHEVGKLFGTSGGIRKQSKVDFDSLMAGNS